MFVEKPLTGNGAQSNELCDLIKNAKTRCISLVGFNRRFNITFRKAHELLMEGAIGEPTSFEAYAFSSDFVGNRSIKKETVRGGVLRDLTCHAIDLVIWFMGNVTLNSVNSSTISTTGVLEAASFAVTNEKGVHGIIRTSWRETKYRLPEIGLIIEGSTGLTLIVNDDELELRNKHSILKSWHKQDLDDNTHFILGGTDYSREDEEYTSSIKTGAIIEPDFHTALKTDDIISRMEKSLSEQIHER
jgi:predicted dehydrogenase